MIDPDGNDGWITIKGNTITITSVVQIDGADATYKRAKKFEQAIHQRWNKSFKHKSETKVYNVKFNIIVTTTPSFTNGFPQNQVTLVDRNDPNVDRERIMSDGKFKSFVESGSSTGMWDKDDFNAGSHEIAHFLGFRDQYYLYTAIDNMVNRYKNIVGETGSGDYPGTPPNSILGTGYYPEGNGVVTQRMIDAIASYALSIIPDDYQEGDFIHLDADNGTGETHLLPIDQATIQYVEDTEYIDIKESDN